jgi:beta-glucosidase
MKKLTAVLICLILMMNISACSLQTAEESPAASGQTQLSSAPTDMPADIYLDASYSTEQRVGDLLSRMSLEDKAGQMIQGEQLPVSDDDMASLGLGSVLSGGGSVPGNNNTVDNWNRVIGRYQKAALSRDLKIPFIYGADAVHGHNTVYGAVVFPQNIGIGAANDPALTEQMGEYVAEEMKLTGILWNFGPCVAVAQDPRWGRTYESISSDPDIVSGLAAAYLKGQQQGGVLATAKHYAGDGGAAYNTGEGSNLIDRGDAAMSEDEFRSLHLAPYKRLAGEGVQCVMVSFSSYNGLKMHENKYLITDVLKDEFGFNGFVVSDWEGVSGIDAPTFEDQVAACVNAGVDMLMEPYRYEEAINAIVGGVESGSIPQERVDDAVMRILTVKFDLGLFEDPYLDNANIGIDELGGEQGRGIAEKLVEESQVLLKNDDGILPFRQGQKIYVTGPAADNIGVQCGGWTLSWQGVPDKDLAPGTSLLEGLSECADQHGLEIITDKNRAGEADVVLLAVGETPYAEYEGDTADLSLTGSLGLAGNAEAIAEAQALGKPVVTVIIAGRNVLIGEYIDDWDAMVMSYLPGTEGGGIAAVLAGEAPFTGKLPMPWYKSTDDIGKEDPDLLFELGYGLTD